jgi:hypothetical protein
MTETEARRLQDLGNRLDDFTAGMTYRPAGYVPNGNRIELKAPAGFTLIKDSYFYYWNSGQGKIMPTGQGFMLVYSDGADPVLEYQVPSVNTVAAVITVVSLCAGILTLAFLYFRRRGERIKSGVISARS